VRNTLAYCGTKLIKQLSLKTKKNRKNELSYAELAAVDIKFGHNNGRESTVNRSLDGSIYPG
jgi:hypothetical protein